MSQSIRFQQHPRETPVYPVRPSVPGALLPFILFLTSNVLHSSVNPILLLLLFFVFVFSPPPVGHSLRPGKMETFFFFFSISSLLFFLDLMSHTLGGEEEEKRKTPVTLKHSNLVTSGHCKVSAHLKCHVRWNGLLINNSHLSVCLSVSFLASRDLRGFALKLKNKPCVECKNTSLQPVPSASEASKR